MKILIPHNVGNSTVANPFVRTLRDGLIACGHEVTCSKDVFWDSPLGFDLVFFQWPESILNKEKTAPNINQIENQVRLLKDHDILIAITCHNLHPHDRNNFLTDVYNYLYGKADVFHHMGDYSFQQLKQTYPNATHFIAPHPAFYSVTETELSQISVYKQKYSVPKDKITIMAFGAFRNSEEREMFLTLDKKFGRDHCLWAPKIYRDTFRKKNFITRLACAGRYLKYSLLGIKMQKLVPEDDDVLPMICASDILFIQRKEVLNSGNLPLGFSAGKIVVGPDVGNVGAILRHTGNPVFDPHDESSIIEAVENAISMYKEGNYIGKRNYLYAQNNCQPFQVAKIISDNIEMVMKI